MGFTVEKNNFVSVEKLIATLATDLTNNGFSAVSIDDQNTDLAIQGTHKSILLKPDTTVDPLAGDEDQPWLLYLVADDTDDLIDLYTFTPTQLLLGDNGEVTVATSRTDGNNTNVSKSGFMFKESQVLTGGDRNHFFSYDNWGFTGNDEESVPISYFLTVTDRGIAFCMWAESYDGDGDKFAWFTIGRMVDSTGAIVVEGKAPLFCVFSHTGGGGSDLNTSELDGIMKFVVRESDVNAPTFPVSATVDTADSTRIINSIQQTSIYEDGKYIINFPRGLNTQRYSYPHELDIIAYASADVTSQYAQHEVNVYDEAQPRKYRALNANHEDNKGMRIYFQTEGMGITISR